MPCGSRAKASAIASLRSAGSANSPRYAAAETALTPGRGPGSRSYAARLGNLALAILWRFSLVGGGYHEVPATMG
jgi:hypothetical protein